MTVIGPRAPRQSRTRVFLRCSGGLCRNSLCAQAEMAVVSTQKIRTLEFARRRDCRTEVVNARRTAPAARSARCSPQTVLYGVIAGVGVELRSRSWVDDRGGPAIHGHVTQLSTALVEWPRTRGHWRYGLCRRQNSIMPDLGALVNATCYCGHDTGQERSTSLLSPGVSVGEKSHLRAK